MPASRSHQLPLLLLLAAACAAGAAAAATMYAPRSRSGAAAFASSWLRRPTTTRSTLAATAARHSSTAARRPSSLGFLSAMTMLAAPRGGWATAAPTIPTTGTGAGFCPAAPAAPFSSTSNSNTCLNAASPSNTAVVAPPTDAAAKKKLQPKYRLSYRAPDYWIRHTDLTFQIEADPVRA